MKQPATFLKIKMNNRLPLMMVGMLSASTAMAASYSIVDGYGNDPTGMCQSVRKSLAQGFVLDAERPLCERRFQLSSGAKNLGLSEIDKTLLPASIYSDILRQILPVVGQEKIPQSAANREKDEKIIYQHIRSGDIKIYASNFDPDNGGKVRQAYVSDITLCDDKDSYFDGSVTTIIKNDDGSLDRSWGVFGATAGIPFIYKSHTYYVKWSSLAGGANKKMLAQLDVYDSVPYDHGGKGILSYAALTPSYCKILQMK